MEKIFLIHCIILFTTAKKETLVAPKFIKMDDVEVLEGEPAQFRAEIIQGTPTPKVQWFREDAHIPENEDFAVSCNQLNQSKLNYSRLNNNSNCF